MPIIQLDRIEKSYFGKTLFQNLSLKIEAGECLALLGDNGTGKTTLLRILSGQEQPDWGTRIGGERLHIGMLSQTLEDEDPNAPVWQSQKWIEAKNNLEKSLTALEVTTEEPEAHKRAQHQYQQALQAFDALGGYQYEYALKTACAGLGLPDGILDRTLGSCSGGEKMRLSLAKLLLSQPDLLLLDEPTNHLDLQAIEWLIDDLKRRSVTLCAVSHDRYFLERIATRCVFLEGGVLRSFNGNYSQALEQKKQEDLNLTTQLQILRTELQHEQEVTQTLLSHRNISGYHSRQKRVEKLQERVDALQRCSCSQKKLHFSLSPGLESRPDKLLLRVQDLRFSYDPTLPPLLDGLNLSIRSQDKIALIGPNGCGKSTFLNLLQGFLLPDSGRMELRNDLRIGLIGQEVQFDSSASTCLDLFLQETDWDEKAARNRLAQFGFTDIEVFKDPSVLSGGERARLALCCCLAQNPELLFLDEPTNHLDIASKEILEQAISRFTGAVFVISHDRFFVSQFANRYLAWSSTELQACDNLEEAIHRSKRIVSSAPSSRTSGANVLQHHPSSHSNLPVRTENPAVRRKAGAKLQQTAQSCSKKLELLQAQHVKLEAEAAGSTDYQIYQKLADLQLEIEACETAYLEAMIAWEDWKTGSETS